MRGKPVNLDEIIREFQALAAQIGPNFRVRDAEANSVWSCYKSRATGLTFNAVKRLAGLPENCIRVKSPVGFSKRDEYVSKKLYHGNAKGQAAYHGKTKNCLGILPNERYCGKKVSREKGDYFCPQCRERKNNQ